MSWTDDENDPQYEISVKALSALTQAVDAKGRQIEVVKIHVPGPLYITKEEGEGVLATVSIAAMLHGSFVTPISTTCNTGQRVIVFRGMLYRGYQARDWPPHT